MRLKEIKPGMAVHCKSIDEKKALYDELCRIGNMKTDSYTDSFDNFKDSNCNYKICDLKRETWCFTTEPATVEFSDLILPDLTNEEVLQICGEICEAYSNKGYNCKTTCPFGFHGMSCTVYRSQNFDKTIEICQRWKFDHKKMSRKSRQLTSAGSSRFSRAGASGVCMRKIWILTVICRLRTKMPK